VWTASRRDSCGNAIEGPYGEAEDRIGRIAQLIVWHVDGERWSGGP
jgi:hypothetical protein